MARAKLKKNTRTKVMGKTSQAIAAVKVWGTENQTFTANTVLSDLEFGRRLAWYNNVKSNGDAKDYLLDYLKNTKDERYTLVLKTNEKLIRPTAGWVARLVTLGLTLSNQQRDTFERLIDESGRSKTIVDDSETPVPTTVVRKPQTVDITSILGEIEKAVDDWRDQPFSLTNYLVERKVSPTFCPNIIAYYRPLADELQLAIDGKDKAVKEAYARYTRRDLLKYFDFVQTIVNDAEKYGVQYVESKSATRKPRKKKEVPLDKKVELLQYLPEFLQARVRSIDPKRIIGAKELWTFDSVSKRLIVLRAATDSGLDLHRSTVINFKEADSAAKRIGRNTSRTLENILVNTRPVCREIFDGITSDKLEITGRINKNTVLLKVFVR